MSLVEQIFNHFHQCFFQSVIGNRLVYNTCWEDPRIDRELLELDGNSRVVMLTSAGCNAMDYLLDKPASIQCVDTNPAQSALAEFKKCLFKADDYSLLWRMLGTGQHKSAPFVYRDKVRPLLSEPGQIFWDHHIDYFLPTGPRSSFYFRGTSGAIAYVAYRYIRHKEIYDHILKLLGARSLDEQRYYFEVIKPHLWNAFSRWVVKRKTTMAMLGVPDGQRAIINSETDGGLLSFIYESIRDVFTKRRLHDNYFWRVYLTGSYTPQCCPNYLKEEYFTLLQHNINQLQMHSTSITNFLKNNPGSYSHFVLLDHQDWLVSRQQDVLAEEWKLIFENAQPGAKILFRSAGTGRSFLPSFVEKNVTFNDQKTSQLHQKDRVGTYGSTHLATVNR